MRSPPSTTIWVGEGIDTTGMVVLATTTPEGPRVTGWPLTTVVVGVGPRVKDVPPMTAIEELTVTGTP
jgi:hypothetical protein